jgi:IS66 C-terminal element
MVIIILIGQRLLPLMRVVIWSVLGLAPTRAHLGSHTQDLPVSFSALEWACCGMAFGLAFLLKSQNPRFYIPHKFRSFLGGNQSMQLAFIFVVSVLVRTSMLEVTPVPIPLIHDEKSYLLAADTYAHGRLTNPTPPAWRHFESYHDLLQPTYMSKYPPAQGLFLAVGEVLFGSPFAGVIITSALMCSALCWLLQAVVPPNWSLIGGLIGVIRLSEASYWDDSLRKNYLFFGADSGGERAASFYTLIGTAKLNRLDPSLYLRTVLARIAEHPINRISQLLPWNLAATLQSDSAEAA